MIFFKTLGMAAMACGLLMGQSPAEDPVMKARAQRAHSQGVNEGDLPPVPKGIIEPPPLPPPEVHVRDMVRTTRTQKRASKRAAGRRGKIVRGKAARGKATAAKVGPRKAKAAPKTVKTAKKRGKRR